ncbi:hypothetical protein PVL29_023525 [Vitis rotundifolia]|uniref:DUF4283 domain-containing protein n=1 Tax=Vitis rotundifolia TaxID=103349 RepID=A0AA39D7L8_VITRO|nr:hypothetical protein PVL29_023525 [Vitis rotundifolia]
MILKLKITALFFLKGRGQFSGWNSLAERLRGLSVAPPGGLKVTSGPEVSLKLKGGSKVLWREKEVEVKSFVAAVKSTPGKVGESVWLEVGEREVQGRLDQMRQCLVGWWGINSAPLPELEYIRSRGLLLFEFELLYEAERVLARGKRSIKENFIILDTWNPKVGCLCKNSNANEAWVRVVGLPFHLWRLEVFKRIEDGYGGFVAVDEDTRSLSEL